MHMDVIPCAVELSDMEREKKKCSSGEISHGLSKSQAGLQGDFKHLPEQVNHLSLSERELDTGELSSYYLFKVIKVLV